MDPGVYAVRIQLVINSVVSDDAKVYCWHLDIYGCLPGEDLQQTIAHVTKLLIYTLSARTKALSNNFGIPYQ